jgi:hypothetical protein
MESIALSISKITTGWFISMTIDTLTLLQAPTDMVASSLHGRSFY